MEKDLEVLVNTQLNVSSQHVGLTNRTNAILGKIDKRTEIRDNFATIMRHIWFLYLNRYIVVLVFIF